MSIAEKLQIIAENEQRVYEAGKQAEYDRFWDSLLENGTRADYNYCFAGLGWNPETFKPKFNMCPTRMNQMFIQSRNLNVDLEMHLNELGVVLDTSKCVVFAEWMAYSGIRAVGFIDTRSCNSFTYAFSHATALETIRLLKLKDDGLQTFNTQTFQNCTALKNIAVEGVIGNDFDIHWSPLTKASVESILNALSTEVTGRTISFNKTAVNAAFTTDEWNALVATKSNWTITLA